jgi:cholesterol oxidase
VLHRVGNCGARDLTQTLMPFDFYAVVVGSGFGASVVAYRLADAGKKVCVLERGKKYPPGSFPRSPRDVARNFWDPASGLFGMFDLWSFRRFEALVSSGLGGGSLIYANVLIRKDPNWFVDEEPGGCRPWPISYDDLATHYKAVEEMLGAQRYPFDHLPYSQTPKTIAMREAAQKRGLDWYLPKLAVTFGNPHADPVPGVQIVEEPPAMYGLPRDTCRLCGECDVGCNYGSKNTLDFNYLSQSKKRGADIRTLAEVRRFERWEGGYRIDYVDHSADAEAARPTKKRDEQKHVTVTAEKLVLGAGTFGSTYLLLRNRSAFPNISPALGTRFSGNGDILSFLHQARRHVGGKSVPRWLNPGFGPVITSAIRVGDRLDGCGEEGRGFYIEDGGVPQFLNWLVESSGVSGVVPRAVMFGLRRALAHARGDPRSNVSGAVDRLFAGGRRSSTWLPVLAMGRDVPGGRMRLKRGDLDLDWSTQSSSAYFAKVGRTLHEIAEALEAKISDWPLWLFKRVITVHPLGGCPMGCSAQEGVVNDRGQVFGYPGVYVVDGSVMPGPVGPNPSLTIAAFADRAADAMLP